MKKFLVALVAMFVMSFSAQAQSNGNSSFSFDRISSYLELKADQRESVKLAFAQLNSSLEALYQIKDQTKGLEAWQKIEARHMETMKSILEDWQYKKYSEAFKQTAKNTAERVTQQYHIGE